MAAVEIPLLPATTPAELSVPDAVTCCTVTRPLVDIPAAETVPAVVRPLEPATMAVADNADEAVTVEAVKAPETRDADVTAPTVFKPLLPTTAPSALKVPAVVIVSTESEPAEEIEPAVSAPDTATPLAPMTADVALRDADTVTDAAVRVPATAAFAGGRRRMC